MSQGEDSFQDEWRSSPDYFPERQPAPHGLQDPTPPALLGSTSSSSTGTSDTHSTLIPSWSNLTSIDRLPGPLSSSSLQHGYIPRTLTLPTPVWHPRNSFYLGPAPPLARSATDTTRESDLIASYQTHEILSQHNRLGIASNLRQLPDGTATLASDSLGRSLVVSVAEIVEASSGQQGASTSKPETIAPLPFAPVSVARENVGGSTIAQLHPLVESDQGKGKYRRVDAKYGDLGQSSKTPANIKKKRKPQPMRLVPRTPKASHRPGRKYEMQWRLGQAPTAGIKDSKEQSNFERVLTAISSFYQGNTGGVWKRVMLQNAAEFDGNGLTEAIATSTIVAAGLVAAGQSESANQVLTRSLPLSRLWLLSQHPQLCFYLTEISTNTSNTVASSLNSSFSRYLAPLATHILGERHPISILLGTPLTVEQKVRMRWEGQRLIHQEHVRAFGTYSYQTMLHLWFWGRVTAAVGDIAEAVRMFESLIQTWEQVYSANSAVAIGAIVEQARVMLASGDASVKVECLLADALRRNDVLTSGQALQPQFMDTAESRLRESSLIFSRLAAFRCLGRLHIMRNNLGNAICCLQQALDIAELNLSEESSVRKMCQTDLAAVKMIHLEQAMGGMTLTDPMSRLPPITSIVPWAPVEMTGTKMP
ncbi:uncharacterized protein Z520_00654 [Fonsecaea multimorphosa CBS 102226]|uniref:Uncharacterized protein n=1 Tax=Fonsecaea multimorphosa CBS 102226 TaxID=1442371 RepID=A0A0D2J3K7_9EURO|nr:uncharacterized protein Z520_00654 [Fonsecaea multimorphosa CBS 102226]KIY03962.1 hypothetical protein Z520_00654 [Fonsecaea multimorphosa CBS 102226]OAL31802.1 hypothetical protein AYO22_00672 [Fonsecaea multimorphosa]